MRKTLKKNEKFSEPDARDDLFVSLMRNKDETYMLNDPRFSEKAMKRRSDKISLEIQRDFEEKYNVNTRKKKKVGIR